MSTTVSIPPVRPPNEGNVFDFGPNDDTPTPGSARVPNPSSNAASIDSNMALCKALDLLKTKDITIASLLSDVKKLRSDLDLKNAIISQQAKDLHCLRQKERETLTLSDMDDGFVDHNPQQLDKVVEDLTCNLVERSPPTKRIKRSSILPAAVLPTITEAATVETNDGEGTQDSLSFPIVPHASLSSKKQGLQEENRHLRERLAKLVATYYHWKVACILSVDRSHQVATELDKISKNFVAKAPKRENGLTSWALMEELYPSDIPMVDLPGKNLIDWVQLGWDYKNQMSCHVKESEQRLLWPKPASFVLDHSKCPICQEQFGPEGGWALGSCAHIYHPQCLIMQCLIRRRCVICAAPFHDRLYTMFNLMTYMPPSWEHSEETTPDTRFWDKDLLCSWREGQHDQDKGPASSQLN